MYFNALLLPKLILFSTNLPVTLIDNALSTIMLSEVSFP